MAISLIEYGIPFSGNKLGKFCGNLGKITKCRGGEKGNRGVGTLLRW
jgi:hypothetical protein